MGSEQSLSNGNEVQEVIQLLSAFSRQNQVVIKISCSVVSAEIGTGAIWSAVAVNAHTDPQVRKRWDSVSVECSGREWVRLMAVYTNLLYRLDFAIGEKEMQSIGIHKA